MHLELIIKFVERVEIFKAQGLTRETCNNIVHATFLWIKSCLEQWQDMHPS
jgi:hypothetical protein